MIYYMLKRIMVPPPNIIRMLPQTSALYAEV